MNAIGAQDFLLYFRQNLSHEPDVSFQMLLPRKYRLPTAAARVRARVWSYGICGGQSGAGAGFIRVLRFPLPIFIPPISPQSPSSIIWGWYNRPAVAAVPSGLSPTPLTIIKKISPYGSAVKNKYELFLLLITLTCKLRIFSFVKNSFFFPDFLLYSSLCYNYTGLTGGTCILVRYPMPMASPFDVWLDTTCTNTRFSCLYIEA
jgi:hypothetical protein